MLLLKNDNDKNCKNVICLQKCCFSMTYNHGYKKKKKTFRNNAFRHLNLDHPLCIIPILIRNS